MRVTAKHLRTLLRAMLAVVMVCVVVLGVAILVVERNPQAIVDHFMQNMAEQAGISVTVEAVDLVVLPVPALAVSNVQLKGEGFSVDFAYGTVRPRLLPLLAGRFEPGRVSLLRPRLWAEPPLSLRHLAQEGRAPSASASSALPLPALPKGCRLIVEQGEVVLRDAEGLGARVEGIGSDVRITGPTSLAGRVSLREALVEEHGQRLLVLENLSVRGESNLAHPFAETPSLQVHGQLGLPPFVRSLDLALDLSSGFAGMGAGFGLDAQLALGTEVVPFSLGGRLSLPRGEEEIRVGDVRLALGEDSAHLDASLRLPKGILPRHGSDDGFRLTGQARVNRLSLTRWLGFARYLPPGLQLALDNITRGSVDFSMDANGLEASNIVAHCSGARFTGTGGVPSWGSPVVTLDLVADHVNLGSGLPEAVGRLPEAPNFFHPPLTDLDGDFVGPPVEGAGFELGYRIRLGGKKVDYGPVRFDDVDVLISPDTKKNAAGESDPVIAASGSLYGGSFKGSCTIGMTDETPLAISVQADRVNAEPLARALDFIPVRKGRLRGEASVRSEVAEGLDIFLAKLQGSVKVWGTGGVVGVNGAQNLLPFGELAAEWRPGTSVWQDGRLGLDGQWYGTLSGEAWRAHAELRGKLWFGADSMDCSDAPAKLSLRMGENLVPLPKGLEAGLRGDFSCEAGQGRFSLDKAHLEALGMEATGQARLNAGKGGFALDGTLAAHSNDLVATLGHIFADPPRKLPEQWHHASLNTEFRLNNEQFSLRSIKASLLNGTITGSLAFQTRRPDWGLQVDLAADKLDLDPFIEARKAERAKHAGQASAKPTATWDFPFLRVLRASGSIRCNELRAWQVRFHNLKLPLNLEKGQLACGPIEANCYGSPLTGRVRLDFAKGLHLHAALNCENFDMTAASNDWGGPLVSGRGNYAFNMDSAMPGPGQFSANLNGIWRFSVTNGVYQNRDKTGKAVGSPTRFTRIVSSGDVTRGMAKCKEFSISGPTLNVAGSGWANLVTETMDLELKVNMPILPEFPMRLHGSIDKPETSIGAGRLLFNSLVALPKGLFEGLGNIVQGTWGLLR